VKPVQVDPDVCEGGGIGTLPDVLAMGVVDCAMAATGRDQEHNGDIQFNDAVDGIPRASVRGDSLSKGSRRPE
jgi:hypothetical protein